MWNNVDKYITSIDVKRRKIYLIAVANRDNILHFSSTKTQILDLLEIQMLRLARNYQLIDLNSNWRFKEGRSRTDDSIMPSAI